MGGEQEGSDSGVGGCPPSYTERSFSVYEKSCTELKSNIRCRRPDFSGLAETEGVTVQKFWSGDEGKQSEESF